MQIFVPAERTKKSSKIAKFYANIIENPILSKRILTKGNRFLNFIEKKMLSWFQNLNNRIFGKCAKVCR